MNNKLLLSIFFIFSTFIINAQDSKAILNSNGVEPVIYELSDKPSDEIYSSIKKYVNKNYANPDKSLKGDIKNEYISINGHIDNAWSYTTMGITTTYGMFYRIDIDIKDNRYRASFYIQDFTNPSGPVYVTYSSLYRKDGTVRKAYDKGIVELENTVNAILQEINSTIIGTAPKNDDW